jgi:putative hydrolase of the HAD superfamily
LAVRAVISDFGGVLTTPLLGSFMAFQNHTGIEAASLGTAMQRISEREGAHPLYELEKGRVAEDDFLAKLRAELAVELGHEPEMHEFKEIYFEALHPNEPVIEVMREAKAAGMRMALLTNNVREWEPYWRTMLPVDEIFELVVDSAFVDMRKPEPEIYELTLERLRAHDPDALGDLQHSECLFVDDIEVNIEAAQALGIQTVHFVENDSAIAEIRTALGL